MEVKEDVLKLMKNLINGPLKMLEPILSKDIINLESKWNLLMMMVHGMLVPFGFGNTLIIKFPKIVKVNKL